MGFEIGKTVEGYDEKMMVEYLHSDYIWFQHGKKVGSDRDGHYWVIDGCKYGVITQTNSMVNCYFYCNWGFEGLADGYYLGQVFKLLPGFEYEADGNYWVKIEKSENEDENKNN